MKLDRLTDPRSSSQYTDVQRREVLSHYAVLGNVLRVSEITGIPDSTISTWKSKSTWWVAELERIREQKQDEIDANLSRIIQKSTEALETRIEQGDEVITKDGETRLKAITGRDLATITGIIFDKRQIMRNLPTSIRTESTDTRLTALADKVRQLQAGDKLINPKGWRVSDIPQW